MQLLDIKRKTNGGGPATLIIDNRFDLLSDGVTMNAYERIRRN